MIPHRFLNQPARLVAVRGLTLTLAAVLGLSGLAIGQAPQSAKAQPAAMEAQLFFSPESQGAKAGVGELALRPKVAQQFYLYVKNISTKEITPSVELRVGGKALAVWKSKEAIKPNSDPVKVNFVEKPPQPGEKPPELALVAGTLEAVALVGGSVASDPARVLVVRPDTYVEDPTLEYNAKTNTLRARIRAKPTFSGPPARVELVLRPDRIPALVAGQKKVGSYAGSLTAKDPVTLFASNLQFQPGVDPRGLVYLTIDGYERAFTYYATFTGNPTSTPLRVDNTLIMRLNTTGLAPSGAPSKVGLEIDNLPAERTVQLGLYRNRSFTEVEGDLEQHTQERDKRILFSPLGPDGALLFRTEAMDWPTKLKTADVFGERVLRLRALDAASEEVPFIDAGAPIERLSDGKYKTTRAIIRELMIDGSRPEKVEFLDFPKQLERGAELPVKATGVDPESGIAQVVFFTGKPQDDKIPPTAAKVEGKPAGKDVYEGKLQAPTDKKGTFDVSVAFINGVGLQTIKTVQIELVDAKTATGGATITGKVVFGDNPIPGQDVLLRDPQGNVKDTAKTGTEGATRGVFTFKNVTPGTYQIVAVNNALRANGQAAVQVGAGEDKKLTEPITLRR
jgi:hypothetical protein